MEAEPARFDQIMRAAFHLMRLSLLAVIAEAQPDAMAQPFHRERDQLIVAQMISVPNNVRASLVYSQDHEHALFFGERIRGQELEDEFPHRSEIAGVAGEFDF